MFAKFVHIYKPMRIVLLTLAFISLALKAPVGMELSYEGWQMIRTLLTPVLAPLIIMVILLDSIIAAIWFTQTKEAEHRRYKIVLLTNLAVAALLCAIWIPYFIEVLT